MMFQLSGLYCTLAKYILRNKALGPSPYTPSLNHTTRSKDIKSLKS